MPNPKLIGAKFTGKIDVKRLYLEGIEIESTCPKCSNTFKKDFKEEYFNYPTLGSPERVYFYCDDCDCDWQEFVILEMTAKLYSTETIKTV